MRSSVRGGTQGRSPGEDQRRPELRLHEEILLLALRDDRGTVDHRAAFYRYAMAGGILAELLLENRIVLSPERRPLVQVADRRPLGNLILDEALMRIGTARRRARLSAWVSRLAGMRDLRQHVARSLCERGILQEGAESVLLFFSRSVYPTIDARHEQRILARLRAAIFDAEPQLDLRTSVLAALASGARLLTVAFSRRELRKRRRRIEQLCAGSLLGLATHDAVQAAVQEACAAACVAACVAVCG